MAKPLTPCRARRGVDVLDAGIFVSKWEAEVPKTAKLVLWGPLQARELGLDGWEVQDGGETGFVIHNPGVALTMGRATSTLIFVRRLQRAFLAVYLGGYPADAAPAQRAMDTRKAVSACELFLTRLAKQPVQFQLQGEIALVDNVNDARIAGDGSPAKALGGGRRTAPRVVEAESVPVADPAPRRSKSEIWEV